MTFLKTVALGLLVGLSLHTGPALRAATTNIVKIVNVTSPTTTYHFSPTNITINAGDTIKWTNTVNTQHDTKNFPASPPLWASPELFANTTTNSFSFTFTNPG